MSRRFLAMTVCGAALLALGYGCASSGDANTTFSDGSGGQITGASSTSDDAASTSASRSASHGAHMSTTSSGHGGNGGSTGSGNGGGGFTSSSTGMLCPDADPGESNDDEDSAFELNGGLTHIMGCADSNVGHQAGTLHDGNDEDWFAYQAEDTITCAPNPTAQVQSSDGTVLELCVYLQCTNGSDVDVTCPDGTTSATSPFQRPGCCGTGEVAPGIDCSGTDEGALVYMRVHDPSKNAVCLNYQLTWHY